MERLPIPPGASRGLRVALVVAALVVVGGLLASILLYRAATDEGELAIRGKGVDAEGELSRRGTWLPRLDTRKKRTIDLPSGEYEVALVAEDNAVKLSEDRFPIPR